MVSELMNAIKQRQRIIFFGNSGSEKSNVLRLLLTSVDLSGTLIIEEKGNIDFIKRNLQVSSSIILHPYRVTTEVPLIIMDSKIKKPMIAVLNVCSIHPTSSQSSLFNIFKRHLLSLGIYQNDTNLYKMLKKCFDLMVGFDHTSVRFYRFGQVPGLVKQVRGPVHISSII